MRRAKSILILLQVTICSFSQIDSSLYFATFGNMTDHFSVDIDFSQTVFIALPVSYSENFFVRIFDPDCGGNHDLQQGLWETNTVVEVFGGEGSISEADSRGTAPSGNYKAGISLQKCIFGRESLLDGKWFSLGPFVASQGEMLKDYPGYAFFKLIVEGKTGDDCNVYAIHISSNEDENNVIEHSKLFSYKYAFLDDDGQLKTIQPELNYTDKVSVFLPVELDRLKQKINLDILVEPIDQ